VSEKVLIISGMSGTARCADVLARETGMSVEVANTRKAGLAALRRRAFAVVIVEDSLAEADPLGADLLWKHSGLAVPLQTNFAISGEARLVRDVRAALARRAQEQALALRAATSTLEGELKSAVTGLLLQSQLALADSTVTPSLAGRLKMMNELAIALCQQLGAAPGLVPSRDRS
jgi:hypothetical protein